jgi:AraC-like DNA-binding protein
MTYREIAPTASLKAFIKCFYIYQSDSETGYEDTVFPSGLTEIIFNLGQGSWATSVDNQFYTTPQVELWGQLTKPLLIQSKGKHTMLGVRFFPHSIAYFLKEDTGMFNNQVSDLTEVLGLSVKNFHHRLFETPNLAQRITLIEAFLLQKLNNHDKTNFRMAEIGYILNRLNTNASEYDMTTIAKNQGMSSRHLRTLVQQHTGLTPKLYNKINRFQNSLKLISKNGKSLTDIAYEAGYFDQSHFIKDFKSFTGVTPSSFVENISPVNQLLLQ